MVRGDVDGNLSSSPGSNRNSVRQVRIRLGPEQVERTCISWPGVATARGDPGLRSADRIQSCRDCIGRRWGACAGQRIAQGPKRGPGLTNLDVRRHVSFPRRSSPPQSLEMGGDHPVLEERAAVIARRLRNDGHGGSDPRAAVRHRAGFHQRMAPVARWPRLPMGRERVWAANAPSGHGLGGCLMTEADESRNRAWYRNDEGPNRSRFVLGPAERWSPDNRPVERTQRSAPRHPVVGPRPRWIGVVRRWGRASGLLPLFRAHPVRSSPS